MPGENIVAIGGSPYVGPSPLAPAGAILPPNYGPWGKTFVTPQDLEEFVYTINDRVDEIEAFLGYLQPRLVLTDKEYIDISDPCCPCELRLTRTCGL